MNFIATALPNRGVLSVAGDDRIAFLQGLVTNDVTQAKGDDAVYACLLTAQGRFLHDFFIVAEGERLLLDCEAGRLADLMRRLKLFRLRSKVEIEDVTNQFRIIASPSFPTGTQGLSYADPRHGELGFRTLYPADAGPVASEFESYDRLRITLAVPDGSRDMEPEKALLLENNIERLNGIAWDKGCYVGQELTARMRYKAVAKKRLTLVRLEGPPVPPGTMLMTSNVEVGEMRSSCGDVGLALLRLDAVGDIKAGNTRVHKTRFQFED